MPVPDRTLDSLWFFYENPIQSHGKCIANNNNLNTEAPTVFELHVMLSFQEGGLGGGLALAKSAGLTTSPARCRILREPPFPEVGRVGLRLLAVRV